jgi:hypothetical protein
MDGPSLVALKLELSTWQLHFTWLEILECQGSSQTFHTYATASS